MNETAPTSDDLAKIRTRLALERTHHASERTLMAWLRTSLAMISFGFSIDTFFSTLIKMNEPSAAKRLIEPTVLGLVLVGLGTTVLCLGTLQHFLDMRRIRAELRSLNGKAPRAYYTLGVALFVITAGIIIFIYMALFQ